MKPNLIRAISENGGLVVSAIDATDIARRMEEIHEPSAVVSAALGRLLAGASLMGSFLKNSGDSLTLRVDGGGPVGTLLAVSDGEGNVRGYASQPIVELPLRADGKLDVGTAVGHNGTLAVVRDTGTGEPYTGRTPLVSGEIAEDITAYYAASEQTPAVCALGVLVDKDLSIRRAGGFLLQLLPGASEDEISKIENNLKKMPSVTQLLEEGNGPWQIIEMVTDGFLPQRLEEKRVEYRCHCSHERTEKILISLGREEFSAMMEENSTAEVSCHFCGKKYHIELHELLAELEERRTPPTP